MGFPSRASPHYDRGILDEAIHRPSSGTLGGIGSRRDVAALVSAYFEFSIGTLSSAERVAVAVAAARACTASRLAALAVAVEDPFAWVPFLRCLHGLPADMHTAETGAARDHLHLLAAVFLAEHGLSVLRPEDVILTDGPMERGLSLAY